MEKVASTVLFPCKFSTSGCQVSMLHTDKGDHEEVCEYRPYSCPCPGASCKWQGALEQVMPHLLNQHRSITTLQGLWCWFIILYMFDWRELFFYRWRYCFFSNRYCTPRRCWLGHDAIMFWSSLHARTWETRKIRWVTTIFRHRPAYWHKEASR